MSARVYVDVDDVLSHTTPALCKLLEHRTGRRVEVASLHTFDLGESLDLGPDELADFMEAAHTAEHLGALAPLEGAAAVLAAWREGGMHISILTGRPLYTRADTHDWLRRHGMVFDRFECVDKYGRNNGGLDFGAILRERFAWAIEDNLEVALKLADGCAERVLLLDSPWNRSVPSLPPCVERIADWGEIERRVADQAS